MNGADDTLLGNDAAPWTGADTQSQSTVASTQRDDSLSRQPSSHAASSRSTSRRETPLTAMPSLDRGTQSPALRHNGQAPVSVHEQYAVVKYTPVTYTLPVTPAEPPSPLSDHRSGEFIVAVKSQEDSPFVYDDEHYFRFGSDVPPLEEFWATLSGKVHWKQVYPPERLSSILQTVHVTTYKVRGGAAPGFFEEILSRLPCLRSCSLWAQSSAIDLKRLRGAFECGEIPQPFPELQELVLPWTPIATDDSLVVTVAELRKLGAPLTVVHDPSCSALAPLTPTADGQLAHRTEFGPDLAERPACAVSQNFCGGARRTVVLMPPSSTPNLALSNARAVNELDAVNRFLRDAALNVNLENVLFKLWCDLGGANYWRHIVSEQTLFELLGHVTAEHLEFNFRSVQATLQFPTYATIAQESHATLSMQRPREVKAGYRVFSEEVARLGSAEYNNEVAQFCTTVLPYLPRLRFLVVVADVFPFDVKSLKERREQCPSLPPFLPHLLTLHMPSTPWKAADVVCLCGPLTGFSAAVNLHTLLKIRKAKHMPPPVILPAMPTVILSIHYARHTPQEKLLAVGLLQFVAAQHWLYFFAPDQPHLDWLPMSWHGPSLYRHSLFPHYYERSFDTKTPDKLSAPRIL